MGDVPHVGGTAPVPRLGDLVGAQARRRVGLEVLRHPRVVEEREVARQRLDLDLRPEGERAGAQRTVHAAVGVEDGVHRLAAHVGLDPHLARDHVHLAAAVRDDGMHADGVVVLEGLAHGVDGHEPDVRRIERVDAEVGRAARMGGAADVAHGLHDAAVVGGGHPGLLHLRLRGGVDHHGQVHVVEVPPPQQLGLAAKELEFPRPGLLDSPLDVAVLLGRYREEDHPAGEVVEGPGAEQPHGSAQESRDLSVVATRVGRAGLRIGHRMAGHHQPVQLAEEGERRPVLDAPRFCPHPRHREPSAGRQAHLLQRLFHEPRRLELLEAQFRIAANGVPEPDDQRGLPVDRLAHRALHLVLGRHRVPFRGSGFGF